MQAKNAPRGRRAELLTAIDHEIRQSGALGVLFSEAIARRVGINPTDLECIDIIGIGKRMTAGELAKATSLTTGAVTGIIDRLERAGLARRERDQEDRRKVYVRVLPEAMQKAGAFYGSLARSMAKLLDDYSDDELAFLTDFFARARTVMTSEIEKLSRKGKSGGGG